MAGDEAAQSVANETAAAAASSMVLRMSSLLPEIDT
jgi:hypothetical protein